MAVTTEHKQEDVSDEASASGVEGVFFNWFGFAEFNQDAQGVRAGSVEKTPQDHQDTATHHKTTHHKNTRQGKRNAQHNPTQEQNNIRLENTAQIDMLGMKAHPLL